MRYGIKIRGIFDPYAASSTGKDFATLTTFLHCRKLALALLETPNSDFAHEEPCDIIWRILDAASVWYGPILTLAWVRYSYDDDILLLGCVNGFQNAAL